MMVRTWPTGDPDRRCSVASSLLGLSLVAVAACYDPAVEDCAVACESPGDCAAGQICGSDGFCSAPGVAGTCNHPVAAVLDASDSVTLHLVVEGRGVVMSSVEEIECEGHPNHPGDCWFAVSGHSELTFVAAATHQHWRFDGWDAPGCANERQCELAMVGDVVLTARFVRR